MNIQEFNKIMAAQLCNNYAEELRANNIKKIVEDSINNFNEDIWSDFLYSFLRYGFGSNIDKLFAAYYIFFKKNFNLDLFKQDLKLNDKICLCFSALEKILTDKSLIIDIPKELKYELEIRCDYSGNGDAIIKFDNSMSKLPENVKLSFAWCESTKIYLPDNLTGKISMKDLYGNANRIASNDLYLKNIKFYFKPVMRNGELASKFDLDELEKAQCLKLKCFRVKDMNENYNKKVHKTIEEALKSFESKNDIELNEASLDETYSDEELNDLIGKIFNIHKIENIYRRKKYGEERLFAHTICTKCGRDKRVFLSNLINDPEKYGSCICSDTSIDAKIDNIQQLYSGEKKIASNTSGYTGVSFVKTYRGEPYNKWRAYIEVDGERTYLGDFDSKAKAIKARKEAGEKGIKWYKDNRNKLTRDMRKKTKKYKNSKYRETAKKHSYRNISK